MNWFPFFVPSLAKRRLLIPAIALKPIASVIVLLGCTALAQAAISPQPESPAGHRAVVQHSLAPQTPYFSANQPNKFAAAQSAMTACTTRTLSQAGYCEVVELDGVAITSARTIKDAADAKQHPLMLWTFRHNDTTVYLAGSVHALKAGFFPLPVQFEEAFAKSDHLVVEVDTAKYSPNVIQQKVLQYSLLCPETLPTPCAKTLSSVVPEPQYGRLQAAASDYGISLQSLQAFKPNFVAQQLTNLALTAIGYDANLGLESYFTQQRGDRPILELETIEQQLTLLFDQPIATQLAMLEETLQQFNDYESIQRDLMSAWYNGDNATFDRLIKESAGDTPAAQAFMRKIVDDRNRTMAAKIAELLSSEAKPNDSKDSYFVLAGAAHMVGVTGIPTLLQQQGYAGRRVFSKDTL